MERNFPDLNVYDVQYFILKDGLDGPFEDKKQISIVVGTLTELEAYVLEIEAPYEVRFEALLRAESGKILHVLDGSPKSWE